tara:strand:- start:482 stop:1207 length:726 start_codon:yes stop_codon:yes gene_type:complete
MSNNYTPLLTFSQILEKYKVGFKNNYSNTLKLRNKVQCNVLKKLNNKYYAKLYFTKYNLKVPKLIYYTEEEEDLKEFLVNEYVAKPSHLSESDNVFINKKNINLVNSSLNKALKKSAGHTEPLMLIEAKKGILIEEYIDYDYELKVFVLYGCPIIADLRKGPREWHRVNFINKENDYVDLDDTYTKIKSIAKDLKLDFFRIDFLVKDQILYASEFAFRPSTILPEDLKRYIYSEWLDNSKK